MLIQQTIPVKMNLFRRLIDFIEGSGNSLRFDVVSGRVSDNLHYISIAESKKEMRDDFRNLRNDFNNTIKQVNLYGKESGTK